jgi:hypothetical protein
MHFVLRACFAVVTLATAASLATAQTDAYTVTLPSKRLANGYTTMPRVMKITRPAEGTYVPGIVIVKTRAAYRVGKGERTLSSAPLAPVLDYMKPQAVAHALVPMAKADDPDIMAAGLDRIYRIAYTEPIEPFDLCKRLMENPDVEYATPEFVAKLSYTPNDPRYSTQNYLAPKIGRAHV